MPCRSHWTLALLSLPLFVGLALPARAHDREKASQIAQKLGQRVESTNRNCKGTKVLSGHAIGVVRKPIDAVMSMVQDFDRYNHLFPHLRKSRVLARRGANAMVYFEAGVLKGAKTLWAQMRIHAKPNEGETRVIEGRMVSGNMDQFAARWELTPVQDGKYTLVAFQVLVDPDLPLPDSVFNSENRKAALRTVERLRSQAENIKATSLARNL